MARRKVTMLEAFQRSARESAERAAAERRRVIADREKEIRRIGTAKAAQDLGQRLSQRANDSVGSLLAGIRGGGAADVLAKRAESVGTPESTPATDINRVPPLKAGLAAGAELESAQGAASPSSPAKRTGPALPGFDSATHGDLTKVATGPRAGALPSESLAESSSESISGSISGSVLAEGDLAEDDLDGDLDGEPEESPFGDATQEEVEHAIASLEDDVFELPMSAKTFALLGAAIIAAVFMMGYTVGHRSGASGGADDGSGFSRAGFDGGATSGRVSGAAVDGLSSRPAPDDAGSAGLAYGGRSGQVGRLPARAAGGTVRAGAQAAPSARASEQAPSIPITATTPEDETFQNKSMKFSILAITYTRTAAHAKLAMETYDYLYEEGFPVIHPIESDSRIYLFVGAAKSQSELEGLRSELQGLRSTRSGSQEFRSAYLVNIDPYR